jgi:hypothetical protein
MVDKTGAADQGSDCGDSRCHRRRDPRRPADDGAPGLLPASRPRCDRKNRGAVPPDDGGELPFDWVVDESRRVRVTQTFDDLADAVAHTAKFYRRSALAQSSDYLEIWCEKDALAGALWDVTSDYDVPLMISRGMPSLTFLHGSAQEILRADERGKQTYIYQFGDHDPSGVLIPQTIERRLHEMCERLDCAAPIVERAALTEEQIEEFELPTRPTKQNGNTHARGFVGDSVELDALPPRELRAMVAAVIEQHISPAETAVLRAAEESERELLRAWRPGSDTRGTP